MIFKTLQRKYGIKSVISRQLGYKLNYLFCCSSRILMMAYGRVYRLFPVLMQHKKCAHIERDVELLMRAAKHNRTRRRTTRIYIRSDEERSLHSFSDGFWVAYAVYSQLFLRHFLPYFIREKHANFMHC